MSVEPRQDVLALLLGYAPVSLFHVSNVFVDIKATPRNSSPAAQAPAWRCVLNANMCV